MEQAVRPANISLSEDKADLRWLPEENGVTEAPLVMDGLATIRDFFVSNLRQDPSNWISYLRGIDFHKLVRVMTLIRGTRLIRYESTGNRTLTAFESRASGINFGLTDHVSRLGGGLQYIISLAGLPVLMRVGQRGR